MRKFCLKIHRWFALPLGVIMAILCFSGLAILLIKDLAPLFDMNAKEMPIYTMVVRLHRWLFMKPENAHDGWTVTWTHPYSRVSNLYVNRIVIGCCHLVAKDQEGVKKSFDR